MKVLVMGGTRFNGRALVDELVSQGHEVSVVNRGLTPGSLPDSVHRIIADRTDPAALKAALAGQDFDCVHDVSAYQLGDVQAMVDILRGHTGHYIFVSSTAIYAPPTILPVTEASPLDRSSRQNDYGRDKILCEEFLLGERDQSDLPATVIALSMVMGPNNLVPDREQRMFARLLAGRPIFIPGDGTTLGQVGFVSDQAEALAAVMGRPVTFGQRYTLSGRDYFSAEGYVDQIAEVVGVSPDKRFVPADVMNGLWDGDLAQVGDELQWLEVDPAEPRTRDPLALPRLHDVAHLVQRVSPNLYRWNENIFFSIDKLKGDIDWAPRHSFPTMVEATYEWYRQLPDAERTDFDFGFESALDRYLAR